MSILKKAVFLMLVLSISISSVLPVSAGEILSDEDYLLDGSTSAVEAIEYDYENDPLYIKYSSQPMTTAIYGASSLVHDSKYANVKKVYGIDVSYFNSNIDWAKVKKSGIDYVIIRIGYRGYSDGSLVLDSKFNEYIEGAKEAGLGVGVYFFTQALNNTEAKAEANFVLKQLNGVKLELPVYIDMEEIGFASSRFDKANLSYNTKTNICKTFCNTIQNGGYRAGVYSSNGFFTYCVDGEELAENYDLWVAQYGGTITYKGSYNMWQYTGNGYVSGVPTIVDMNVLYFNKAPAKVKNLTATQSGINVKLSWSESFGAYGYAIYAKDLATNKITEVCKTTAASKTVAVPYARTRFYIKAYYKINDNYSYSAYSDGVTVYSKKVTDLSLARELTYTQTSLTLTWTKLANATGYQIQMYDADKQKYKVLGYTNGNTYTIENLAACTTYKFRIRSYYNSDGAKAYNADTSTFGVYSNEIYAGTKTARTQNVKVSVSGTSTVKVTWDKVTERCDGYQIVVYDCASKKPYTAGWTDKNTTTFVVKNLAAGSKYRVTVRPYYTYNNVKYPGDYSPYSDIITLCAAPENLKASKIAATQFTLTWSKTTGASGYRIYELVNNEYVFLGSCTGNSYTIKNLSEYSIHKYRVRAYTTFNSKDYIGAWSSLINVNLASAPTGFSVGTYTDTSVTLKWKASTGADKYMVYLYTPENRKYVLYKTVTAPNCTITGLNKNSYYRVIVKSVYGKHISDSSVSQLVSTKCNTPTGVKLTKRGSTYLTISWNKVHGATHYWIYKYDSTTKKFYKYKKVGDVSSATLTGLKSNASHKFIVFAIKETSLKTYVSNPSAILSVWTTR